MKDQIKKLNDFKRSLEELKRDGVSEKTRGALQSLKGHLMKVDRFNIEQDDSLKIVWVNYVKGKEKGHFYIDQAGSLSPKTAWATLINMGD